MHVCDYGQCRQPVCRTYAVSDTSGTVPGAAVVYYTMFSEVGYLSCMQHVCPACHLTCACLVVQDQQQLSSSVVLAFTSLVLLSSTIVLACVSCMPFDFKPAAGIS
jgi:hypothetical protein